jgi:DNA adenine methylase
MRPFIKWAGGKRWLTDHALLDRPVFSGKYIEPFLGGAAMFFHIRPQSSILSDLNSRLIQTYQAIRENPLHVQDILREHHGQHCKDYYYEIRDARYADLPNRAAQFLYLNRTCWNGLYRENLAGKFNVPIGTKSLVFDPDEDFEAISAQLQNADISCCDFEATIDNAEDGDFVFCDPPYTTAHNMNGFVKYNQHIFSWDDQVRLRDAAIRAMERGATVVVTNADHPSLHVLYGDAEKIDVVERASVISGISKGRRMTTEILVTV